MSKRNVKIEPGRNKILKNVSKNPFFPRKMIFYLTIPLLLINSNNYPQLKNYHETDTFRLNFQRKDLPPSEIKGDIKRQKYLEEIFLEKEMPYCSGIVYDKDGSQIIDFIRAEIRTFDRDEAMIESSIREYEKLFRGGNYDAQTPEILELSELGRKTKIFVGRQFFEEKRFAFLTKKDIECIIANHENQHTKQYAEGLGLEEKKQVLEGIHSGSIDKTIYYALGELDANYHELRNILSGKFKTSEHYKESVKNKFLMDYITLYTSIKNSSPLQKKIIERGLSRVENILPR